MSIQSASLAHWTLFDVVLVAVLLFEDLGEAVVTAPSNEHVISHETVYSKSATQMLMIIIRVDKIYYSKITIQNYMFQVP